MALPSSGVKVQNSFLGADGVGETIERRLWRQGITHWDSFRPDCEGIGDKRRQRIESFIEEGTEALAADDVAYFDARFPNGAEWRFYESFRDQTCFFDIETTGLNHHSSVVTTVSIHQDGQTETLVRGDDLTADALERVFESAGLVVTFNGARFDVPFLEASFDLDIDTPHLDLMSACRKLDLYGGLTEVERHFGIERDRPDISGEDAVRLWYEHERGVDGALDRLIEYNREDTRNMVPVLESVVEELDEAVFPDD